MNNIAIVTCRVLPEPDPDQELLLEALRKAGLDAALLPWDDPEADPAAFDLCVIRSTWDYYKHPGSFLRWVAKSAAVTRLMNPPAVVRWNHHKRYLEGLQQAGVPVVPTVWFGRGEEAGLDIVMGNMKWNDVVVKPAVSASSFKTRRFRAADAADLAEGRLFLRDLLTDRDAMVQKYMPSVEEEGEKAVVWIDGEFTHAVRKSPRFSGADEEVSGALTISPKELALAKQAMARVTEKILYGRVDVVKGPGGKYFVSELELIEPSLFLLQHPPALDRLVAAIARIAGEKAPGPQPVEPMSIGPAAAERVAERRRIPPASGPERTSTPRRPGIRKPLGWKPTGRKSGGLKRPGGRPASPGPREGGSGEWKGRGERPTGGRPTGERPAGGKPGGWKAPVGRPGGWKSGGKPGRSKSGGAGSGGWKPRGGKPGGWKSGGGKSAPRRPGGRKSP